MAKRTTQRLAFAAVVSIAAGVLSAYVAPVAAHDEHAAERVARRTISVVRAACGFDWDDAPVARAMFSIRQ